MVDGKIQSSIKRDRWAKKSITHIKEAYKRYKEEPSTSNLLYLQSCLAHKGAMEELRDGDFNLYKELSALSSHKSSMAFLPSNRR